MTSLRPLRLISVVLPTHNGSRFLAESIESVRSQTYADWELIIVDDASTDETPSVIARYVAMDPRIRSLRNDANLKLPASLNRGFAEARGEYFTWTSDDNMYRPNAVQRMQDYLGRHRDVVMVYCDFTHIDCDGRVVAARKVGEPEGLLRGNCVQGCFLYRSAAARQVGPYAERLFLVEDYEYWLRLWSHGRIAPLHEDLYLYRVHPASLTARNSRNRVRWLMAGALCRHITALGTVSRGDRHAACLYWLRGAYRGRRTRDACAWTARALALGPWATVRALGGAAARRSLRAFRR
ncbi:MAG TPA: glycosyltransferase [Chthonomonadales bacterium]|nr:glycosyltransferase [Chthonomonadales bacterium]